MTRTPSRSAKCAARSSNTRRASRCSQLCDDVAQPLGAASRGQADVEAAQAARAVRRRRRRPVLEPHLAGARAPGPAPSVTRTGAPEVVQRRAVAPDDPARPRAAARARAARRAGPGSSRPSRAPRRRCRAAPPTSARVTVRPSAPTTKPMLRRRDALQQEGDALAVEQRARGWPRMARPGSASRRRRSTSGRAGSSATRRTGRAAARRRSAAGRARSTSTHRYASGSRRRISASIQVSTSRISESALAPGRVDRLADRDVDHARPQHEALARPAARRGHGDRHAPAGRSRPRGACRRPCTCPGRRAACACPSGNMITQLPCAM